MTLDEIEESLDIALQVDFENGVVWINDTGASTYWVWLNDIAGVEFSKKYPTLSAAITTILELEVVEE